MSPTEIQQQLSLGEGQQIDFKANCSNVSSIGNDVCGMLNATGGYVVCGADDKGNVLGVKVTADDVVDLEQRLRDGISPKSLISVQAQKLQRKTLLVIEVPAGKDVPYAFRDSIYMRVGEKTRKADVETIRDLVMRRQIEPERWERRFSFANLETDMDDAELRAAVAAAQKVRRTSLQEVADPLKVLEELSVAKYGRLTNGGDVLFAPCSNVAFGF